MNNIRTKTKKTRNEEEKDKNVPPSSIDGREVEEGQKFQY